MVNHLQFMALRLLDLYFIFFLMYKCSLVQPEVKSAVVIFSRWAEKNFLLVTLASLLHLLSIIVLTTITAFMTIIFTWYAAVKKRLSQNMKQYVAFIDFQKAYDNVQQAVLLQE